MNCENVNLKELLKKAEEYDELKKDRDYWEKTCRSNLEYHKEQIQKKDDYLERICEFLSKLYKTENAWEKRIDPDNLLEELPEILEIITDEKRQGFLLAKERRDNNEKFKEELNRLEGIYNRKAEELDFAWQKFRAVKTSRLQQTIDEINAEKI